MSVVPSLTASSYSILKSATLFFEGHSSLVKSLLWARYLTDFHMPLRVEYCLSSSMTVSLSDGLGILRSRRLSACKIVPTIRTIPESLLQGSKAPLNHLRIFSRRSLFITSSSFSISSHIMMSGRDPFQINPRSFCSAPLAMMRNLCPSSHSTMMSASVSLVNWTSPFSFFLIPNSSMSSALS